MAFNSNEIDADAFPEPTAHNPEEPDWEFEHLQSALSVLSPDCDDSTWATYRIAALANAAHDCPDRADDLRRLAINWSSGKLQGRPAVTWTTTGDHGHPRKDRFQRQWDRYVNSAYAGKRVTVRSIFFEARKAGWTPGVEPGGNFENREVTGQ